MPAQNTFSTVTDLHKSLKRSNRLIYIGTILLVVSSAIVCWRYLGETPSALTLIPLAFIGLGLFSLIISVMLGKGDRR